MIFARYISLVLLCFLPGCNQDAAGLKWNEFRSTEARVSATMPCAPKETHKSFQEQPGPIRVYEFDCETEGMRFLISVKNHMNDYSSKTIDESFETSEFVLNTMFGDVEKVGIRKDFTTNGFASRTYDLQLKEGGKVRSLTVVNEFATYEALIGVTQENTASTYYPNFDDIADRFIGSLQVFKN
jgi:hypothetical protein